jgi:hypothetical protein
VARGSPDGGAVEWGVEWKAAKYQASRRVVPCVPPLHTLLRRAFIARARAAGLRALREGGLRPITLERRTDAPLEDIEPALRHLADCLASDQAHQAAR